MKKYSHPQYITTEHAKNTFQKTNLNTFVEVYSFEGHKIKTVQQDNGQYFLPEYVNINLN